MGEDPIYSPFFGVMGATSAMVFSGKLFWNHTLQPIHIHSEFQFFEASLHVCIKLIHLSD